MYKEYFRFSGMPFSIAPDPRFLFMSDRHREALAHLLYGVQGDGGIVLLTGEVGTGKTTICRSMLEQLPENIDVAFILNPLMSVEELLQTVCEEYHITVFPHTPGIKAYVDAIHARLLETNARGRRAILIIDEAQNLDPRVLEQLRLLTNLETSTRKLLQIILIGQPELQDLIARPEMRQVAQRVIARYHLAELSASEVKAYVDHRLRIAGASASIFPAALNKRLFRATRGVPRLINLISDRALLGAYVRGQQQVSVPILRQAIKEVLATRAPQRRYRLVSTSLLVLTALAIYIGYGQSNNALHWLAPLLSAPRVEAARPDRQQSLSIPVAPDVARAPDAQVLPAPEPAPEPAAGPQLAAMNTAIEDASTTPVTSDVDWPSNIPRSESEARAFRSLFKLYAINVEALSKTSPCRQAEERGMRCYVSRGGLSDLILLNQPAVIRLYSSDGRDYSATLTAIEAQVATLLIADVARRVAVSDLANGWTGHYTIIWKPAAGFRDPLMFGQRGQAVAALRRAMMAIDGVEDNGSDVFDRALVKRVRAFQLTDGIRPDGFVGPLTAIRINVRSGLGGPLLLRGSKG